VVRVELVTRQGCHLCDDALSVLRGLGVEPRLRDVDGDPELFRLYDFRVPVVLVDGEVAGEGRIDQQALSRALAGRLRVLACGPDEAAVVHRLTQAAFAEHTALDPPSGVTRETVESVRLDLEAHGGALALGPDGPVGCLRYEQSPDHMWVRRVAVLPSRQGRGLGRALMGWAEREAAGRGLDALQVGVRLALPANLAFYQRLGYTIVSEHAHPGYDRPTWVTMRKRI
jgi:GNAT superfamily N-acetyltransferase